jgi:hypothetical protein
MPKAVSTALLLWSFQLLPARAADFAYPLEPGNQWIYRSGSTGETWTVVAEAVEEFNGIQFTRLTGFPGGPVRLRLGAEGRLLAWDSSAGTEKLWVDLGAEEGDEFEPGTDPCNLRARVASRNADYSGPLGEFRDAIQISYAPGPCADAGITEESYVSSLGLVRRVLQTIAGPRAFDVVYVRLGGRVYASEPHAGSGLALDRTVYEIDPAKPIPPLTARLTIRNDHPEPLELQFPSGQIYDLRIENEGGETVFLWSAARLFIQALQTLAIERGERNYVITVPLVSGDGAPLPAGSYGIEAWLTTSPPVRFRAAATFEIRMK